MATNTFGTLRAAVATMLHRSDLTSEIPLFIEFATARFSDELRTPEMETLVSTTLTGEWTALPTDYRAMKLLEAGGKVLEYRTPWQLQRLVQRTAVPTVPVYTVQDMQFRVYPFPTSTAVELTYYAALDALEDDSDTNWLLTKRPDVYLYGAIAHARIYLNDDPRVVFAEQFIDKYIASANRAAQHIAIGSGPLAVTPG